MFLVQNIHDNNIYTAYAIQGATEDIFLLLYIEGEWRWEWAQNYKPYGNFNFGIPFYNNPLPTDVKDKQVTTQPFNYSLV